MQTRVREIVREADVADLVKSYTQIVRKVVIVRKIILGYLLAYELGLGRSSAKRTSQTLFRVKLRSFAKRTSQTLIRV